MAIGWNHSDLGAVAETLSREYGVSLGVVGLFTGVLFIVHAACQIPAGRAVDALGARRLAVAALWVLVVSNAVALLAPEPSLAFVARALTGVGTGLGFVAGIEFVRAENGSPYAQGLYGGSTIGGAGLALALVPLLAEPLGWRAPFVGAMCFAGLATLLILAGPRSATRPSRPRDRRRAPVVSGDATPLLRLCLLSMAAFGLSVIVGNWVVTLLLRSDGLEAGIAGAIGSAVLLGGIVGRPLGGALARRYPTRNRVTVGASFATAAVGTLALALGVSPPISIAGAVVLGLAAGIPFAPLFGAAARARPASPATAVAVVNMASNLLIVVGVPLLGLSFSLPGDGRLGIGAIAFLWLAAISLVPAARELEAESAPSAEARGTAAPVAPMLRERLPAPGRLDSG